MYVFKMPSWSPSCLNTFPVTTPLFRPEEKKHELCFHDWNHDDNDKDDDDEDGDFNWTRGWEILSLRIDQLINDKTRTMSRSTLTVQSPWLSSQNSPATVPMYFTCNDAHDYFQWFFISILSCNDTVVMPLKEYCRSCDQLSTLQPVFIFFQNRQKTKKYSDQIDAEPYHADCFGHLSHHLESSKV